jgi:hypothetical protein
VTPAKASVSRMLDFEMPIRERSARNYAHRKRGNPSTPHTATSESVRRSLSFVLTQRPHGESRMKKSNRHRRRRLDRFPRWMKPRMFTVKHAPRGRLALPRRGVPAQWRARRSSGRRDRRADQGGGSRHRQAKRLPFASSDEEARPRQKRERQMDAIEGPRQARPRLMPRTTGGEP